MNALTIPNIGKNKVRNFFAFLLKAETLKYCILTNSLKSKKGRIVQSLDVPDHLVRDLTYDELRHVLSLFYGKIYKNIRIKKTEHSFMLFKSDGSKLTNQTFEKSYSVETRFTLDSMVWYVNRGNGFLSYIVIVPNGNNSWRCFNLSIGAIGPLNIQFNLACARYRGKL